MKFAALALCLVLPPLYICTPLPDFSAVASSDSGTSVNTNGGNVVTSSNSSSNVSVNNPPAVPPTVPATSTPPLPSSTTTPPCDSTPPPPPPTTTPPCDSTPPPPPPTTTTPPSDSTPSGGNTSVDVSSQSNANVSLQGGPGGQTSVNASSSANASVTVSGNKCGKPDVDEFTKYLVLVKNEGDVQKFTGVNWMLWKTSSVQTKVQTQEPLCAPRYYSTDCGCKGSQYKITVQSETDILYEVWGTNGQKVLYIKQQLSITSQKYHIYTSKVVTIASATSGSQKVVAVQNDQTIKGVFDNNSFAVLDTDFKTYMICTTSGQSSVTFVSLSQEVYENDQLKQEVSQKVTQVLQANNLGSNSFVEVTSKFEVDINQYQWQNCQNGSGNNGNNGSGNNGQVDVNANSSSKVDVNQSGNNGTPSGNNGTPSGNNSTPSGSSGDNTKIHAGSDSSAKVDVKNQNDNNNNNNKGPSGDTTNIDANDVKNKDNNGTGNNVSANANSNANASVNSGNNGGGSCSGGSGKPSQQGFTTYSVLKISNDEFKSKINKITWHIGEYTPNQDQVKTDVTVCADRYICTSCKAVKFQYVVDDGCWVLKEWGYDGTNLLYIQENISFSTQDFVILKAEVVNVMKATKDSDTAPPVQDDKQVKSYLSAEYAVLYTDYKNVFIGITSSEKGSIVFVAYSQEVYENEEERQQYAEKISQVLKESGVDVTKLSKLTKKWDVDTNKYNKKKVETKTTDDGKTTTTKQETEKDGGGKSKTETTVSTGSTSPPPSTSGSGGTQVDANASTNANANVNNNTPSPAPSGGGTVGTNVDVNSSSNSSVNLNNNGSSPCTGSPPPTPSSTPPSPSTSPSPPPATTPTSTPSINASASSDSSTNVKTNGEGTQINTNANSDASVMANNGNP